MVKEKFLKTIWPMLGWLGASLVILGYYFFLDFPDVWTWSGLAIIVCSGVYITIREQHNVVIK